MIQTLTKEKEDEIKHKDFCVEELHQNTMDTNEKEHEKKLLVASIEDLKMTMETLTKELDELKKSVADMETQIKRRAEDRELENNEFKKVLADHRGTQKLLEAAYKILKPALDSFVQEEAPTIIKTKKTVVVEAKEAGPAGPPPPAGFKPYEKKGGGVLGMLKEIMADTKNLEKETIHDEEDAQKAYEDFVMESNASIDAAQAEIVTKSKEKAKAQVEHVDAEGDLEKLQEELDGLANEALDLHHECDYILKNFTPRQEARDAEIEGLKQASAILSGAKFSLF